MVIWSIILAVLFIVFVLVHALILPKAFLKADCGKLAYTDRGYKRVEGENGQSVVYEPDLKMRGFVKQYALSERGGKKFLVCRLDEKVRYIELDVAVFNKEGNVVKILNLKEIIGDEGYSEACELPAETAFVTLSLVQVNGKKYGKGLRGEVSSKRLALYLSLSGAADIIGVVFAKFCVTEIFGGIYSESFLLSGMDWLYTVLVSLGVAAINVLAAAIAVILKSGRKKNAEVGDERV